MVGVARGVRSGERRQVCARRSLVLGFRNRSREEPVPVGKEGGEGGRRGGGGGADTGRGEEQEDGMVENIGPKDGGDTCENKELKDGGDTCEDKELKRWQ